MRNVASSITISIHLTPETSIVLYWSTGRSTGDRVTSEAVEKFFTEKKLPPEPIFAASNIGAKQNIGSFRRCYKKVPRHLSSYSQLMIGMSNHRNETDGRFHTPILSFGEPGWIPKE